LSVEAYWKTVSWDTKRGFNHPRIAHLVGKWLWDLGKMGAQWRSLGRNLMRLTRAEAGPAPIAHGDVRGRIRFLDEKAKLDIEPAG
jgi:hypothetical protein